MFSFLCARSITWRSTSPAVNGGTWFGSNHSAACARWWLETKHTLEVAKWRLLGLLVWSGCIAVLPIISFGTHLLIYFFSVVTLRVFFRWECDFREFWMIMTVISYLRVGVNAVWLRLRRSSPLDFLMFFCLFRRKMTLFFKGSHDSSRS